MRAASAAVILPLFTSVTISRCCSSVSPFDETSQGKINQPFHVGELSRIRHLKSRSTALSRDFALLRQAVAQQAMSSDRRDYMTSLGALSMAEAAAEKWNDAQSAHYFEEAINQEPEPAIISTMISDLGLKEIGRLMLRDIFSKCVFKPT